MVFEKFKKNRIRYKFLIQFVTLKKYFNAFGNESYHFSSG